MIKRIAVLAIFLGTSSAVNLKLYNQLIAAPDSTPPELKSKEADAVQKAADGEVAKKEIAAAKISSEATAAAANADPILAVATAHNAPRTPREVIILDPKILATNKAVADAVAAAKKAVEEEPKIKAQRLKYEELLPDPLAPDMVMNPLVGNKKVRTAQ